MREIKFRAWDNDNDRWVESFSIRNDGAFEEMIDQDNIKYYNGCEIGSMILGGNIELMQYTGLKDKNGKEIYEGDIFGRYKDKYNKNSEGESLDVVAYVGWDSEYGCYDIYEKFLNDKFNEYEEDKSDKFDNCNWSSYKVIGNLFENPELINK